MIPFLNKNRMHDVSLEHIHLLFFVVHINFNTLLNFYIIFGISVLLGLVSANQEMHLSYVQINIYEKQYTNLST